MASAKESAPAAAPDTPLEAQLKVSPTIVELAGKAGDVLTEPITVEAPEAAIDVALAHADFGFNDANYQVQLIRDDAPETTAFSTRGWFSLPKTRYHLKPGGRLELPLRIEIPKNTPGGTYLGAALFRVVPGDSPTGASQVQAVPETGPLMFIAVEGGDPPKAAVKKFDVPGLVTGGPIRPKLMIENLGDEFFSYEGTVSTKGPGKDVTVDVPRKYVVPGEPRTVLSAKGAEDEPTPLELGSKHMKLGRYEVTARLRIEPTGTTLVAHRTVWVVPIWARVLAAAILLVFAACAALVIRWVLERRRLAPYLDEELTSEGAADGHDDEFDDEHAVELDEDEDPYVG